MSDDLFQSRGDSTIAAQRCGGTIAFWAVHRKMDAEAFR